MAYLRSLVAAVATLSLATAALLSQSAIRIDYAQYTPLDTTNCQPPFCNSTNKAVFVLSFVSTTNPVSVQKSVDLSNWVTVSTVSIMSTNSNRWYWGQYVNDSFGVYRLAPYATFVPNTADISHDLPLTLLRDIVDSAQRQSYRDGTSRTQLNVRSCLKP